jgi:hypothetical protein
MNLRALGTLFLFVFLVLPLASACPDHLQCRNFTNQDKRADCNYAAGQGFSPSELQDVLCTLWDYDYGYDSYHQPTYPPLDTDLTLSFEEIDTSSFILASKIILLFLFSYFLYSILTKPSFMRKCLPVA